MNTMILSETDEFGYFTGRSYETPTYSAIPAKWTTVRRPAIPEGKYLVLRDLQWVIVDSLPIVVTPVEEDVPAPADPSAPPAVL